MALARAAQLAAVVVMAVAGLAAPAMAARRHRYFQQYLTPAPHAQVPPDQWFVPFN